MPFISEHGAQSQRRWPSHSACPSASGAPSRVHLSWLPPTKCEDDEGQEAPLYAPSGWLHSRKGCDPR